MKILSTAFVLAMTLSFGVTACSHRQLSNERPVKETNVILSQHDLLSDQLVRAVNHAEAVEGAASIANVVDRTVITHDIYTLRKALEEADKVASHLEDKALPGEEQPVAELSRAMKQHMHEAQTHTAAADADMDMAQIDRSSLERDASEAEHAIRMAAEEHDELMVLVSDSESDLAYSSTIRPHHALAFQEQSAIALTNRMLVEGESTPDWKAAWQVDAPSIAYHLQRAQEVMTDTALMARNPEDNVRNSLILDQNRDAQEHLKHLEAELKKANPSRAISRREAEMILGALDRARNEHRQLMIAQRLQYPEYDFAGTGPDIAALQH